MNPRGCCSRVARGRRQLHGEQRLARPLESRSPQKGCGPLGFSEQERGVEENRCLIRHVSLSTARHQPLYLIDSHMSPREKRCQSETRSLTGESWCRRERGGPGLCRPPVRSPGPICSGWLVFPRGLLFPDPAPVCRWARGWCWPAGRD